MTCSRASHNSRFNRRTSAACRSSAVEPYNDEPPDSNDAALPCTVTSETANDDNNIRNERKKETRKPNTHTVSTNSKIYVDKKLKYLRRKRPEQAINQHEQISNC